MSIILNSKEYKLKLLETARTLAGGLVSAENNNIPIVYESETYFNDLRKLATMQARALLTECGIEERAVEQIIEKEEWWMKKYIDLRSFNTDADRSEELMREVLAEATTRATTAERERVREVIEEALDAYAHRGLNRTDFVTRSRDSVDDFADVILSSLIPPK